MITLGGESVTGVPACFVKLKKYLTNCFRGGQSVHEGVAAPDPSYPNCLSAHPWGAALRTPRGGGVSSLGEALARHHIQHASSTGSLAWGGCPNEGDFAAAAATRGLSGHRRSAFDFRLRRTRHWRAVAPWTPSGPHTG